MKMFLSSTYTDLIAYRRAAAEAVERLGQQAGRMELFGARPEEPLAACINEVDECDLFLGIYAHRYGFIPQGSLVSITEAEFDRAELKNKPLFCFVIDDEHLWPPKLIDDEPGRSRLRSFKAKLGSRIVREIFTTSEDLAFKIAAALGRYLSNYHGVSAVNPIGYSMGTAEFFDKVLSELANLRLELQSQKELLRRVNHVSLLLETSADSASHLTQANTGLPDRLEGCWVDSKTGSYLYARFVSGQLIVPYCYAGNSRLVGVFFDFREGLHNVFFARYKWFDLPIKGFAYIEISGPGVATGGWWFSEDVPKQAREHLEQINPDLERMNEMLLSRLPGQLSPKWVDDFFAIPADEMLK